MASDYDRISRENLDEYGRNRTGWREDLLVGLYPDRTHFVFELLQNAEDALLRKGGSAGSGRVHFVLAGDAVRFSHYGDPFTTEDVRGVCAIARRAKETDLTAIGRFGIGFKSVYAITDSPEIHSGNEHFVVTDYVQPAAVSAVPLADGETMIRLPLRAGAGAVDIAGQFERLGDQRTLLFLRAINEIEWSTGGRSGSHRREEAVQAEGVRRVLLVSEADGNHREEEAWLVFSREVRHEDAHAGYVELAFRLTEDDDGDEAIGVIHDSRLAAFFPTDVATHLGMLVQGPYRTTPARDNIPRDDDWNRHLVRETASLLVEALRHLRDRRLLAARTFEALPLDRDRFSGGFFAPLFDAVLRALAEEPLLPRHRGGYVAASQARLADKPDVRNLVSRQQLAELLRQHEPVAWLAGDVSEAHTPALYHHLVDEHGVEEIGTYALLALLRHRVGFLQGQTDGWIRRLYSFLGRNRVTPARVWGLPLIRLEDGTHVEVRTGTGPAAFLPTTPPSGFSNTVRRAVCSTTPARGFLESLGLSEPDLVDELVRNVLPRYRVGGAVGAAQYREDLHHITDILQGAPRERRDRLVEALRSVPFVRVEDAGSRERSFVRPGDAYIATRQLRDLFQGVRGVLIVDGEGLGPEMTRLLESCGARRTLAMVEREESKPYAVSGWDRSEFWQPFGITSQGRREMRRAEGEEAVTRDRAEVLTNRELRGLGALLEHMAILRSDDAAIRAGLLWDALRDAPKDAFSGTYSWFRYGQHSRQFPSAAVRLLEDSAWVPDGSGGLKIPARVEFASLGWAPDHFLEAIVDFRQPEPPSALAALADEAGVDLDSLEALKRGQEEGFSGSELLEAARELRRRRETARSGPVAETGAAEAGSADSRLTVHATPAPAGDLSGLGGRTSGPGGAPQGNGAGSSAPAPAGRTSAGAGGKRTHFVSYIGVHAESDSDPDPDGLSQERRTALERDALDHVIMLEPTLRRTRANNAGFDLYEADESGAPVRWIEVKAMSSDMRSRPATLTHTQIDYAREKGSAYWLYVVEHAGTDGATLVKVVNPAGRASTYTFDEGWRNAPTGLPDGARPSDDERASESGR